jgi:hypothetical protein
MYLTAACLPLLRPVVEKIIPVRWKGIISFSGSSRYNHSDYSMEHGSKNRAVSSSVAKPGPHDGQPDSLEMGCRSVTFANEVNGRSVSETCLVHPGGIEVTNEISVSITHSPTTEGNEL